MLKIREETIMINGGHTVIYSTDADADRAFLRDVLKLTHVDVGGGWLIFGMPSSEIAVHPYGKNIEHIPWNNTHTS